MKLPSFQKQFLTLFIALIGFHSVQAQVWTLKECIDTAQVYSKNLQLSRNNIELSEQKRSEATANLFPKLQVNADYKYFTNLPYQLMPLTTFGGPDGQFKEAQFGVPHNISANVQLTMPLYNSQIFGAIQTTTIASELTKLQFQKTEEQVFVDISNLYYNAQILHHQLAFIDSNLNNATKLLMNIRLLKEQLIAKGTDVNKIELQVEQLKTQKEIIVNKFEQTISALKFSMGIPIEKQLQIDPNIHYQSTNEYPWSTTVDIHLANVQTLLLTSELSTLKNSRLPSLSLFGTYGTTGFGYDKEPNEFLKFFPVGFVGIQLSYPLFTGTVTQRKINQKNLELQNSELQLKLLSDQNAMQVENVTRQRFASQRTIETTVGQIALAKKIYDQTILQQKEGTASITDVLLADNSLREAQQTYLSAVIDYLKADLELKKMTGNISSQSTNLEIEN